jgi:hypothetical protein
MSFKSPIATLFSFSAVVFYPAEPDRSKARLPPHFVLSGAIDRYFIDF